MKILIIDDQIVFAEGMKTLIEQIDPFVEISFAEDIKSGLASISKKHQPDLILLDINLTAAYDYCLIDQLRDLNIESPVLIISSTDSQTAASIAIEKGAVGFITKSSDKDTILKAIQTILNGGQFYTKQATNFQQSADQGIGRITSRQQEVLYLLSQGMLNKQIANELNISANTVKTHLHGLFMSLNASNRTTAVKNAQKYGLL